MVRISKRERDSLGIAVSDNGLAPKRTKCADGGGVAAASDRITRQEDAVQNEGVEALEIAAAPQEEAIATPDEGTEASGLVGLGTQARDVQVQRAAVLQHDDTLLELELYSTDDLRSRLNQIHAALKDIRPRRSTQEERTHRRKMAARLNRHLDKSQGPLDNQELHGAAAREHDIVTDARYAEQLRGGRDTLVEGFVDAIRSFGASYDRQNNLHLNKQERTSAAVGTASGGPTPTSRNIASNTAEPHAARGDKQVHLRLDDSQEWTVGATAVARLATLQPGQVIALRFSPTQGALVDVPLVPSDAPRLVPNDAVDASVPASPTLTARSFQECAVCVDTFPLDDYPSLAACQHETNICRDCFTNWIAEQLNETAWDQIECPSSECSTRLTHDDVKPNVSEEVFLRFDRLSTQAALEGVPGYFRCHAEGCDYGHIHNDEGGQDNIWHCQNPDCGARICTVHKIPFHTSETCKQFDERKRFDDFSSKQREAASLKAVRQISKPCPNADCGINIEKMSGCDYMTCRRCKHEFCYRCSAPYRGDQGIVRVGNSAHATNCRHYRHLPYVDEGNGFIDSEDESDDSDDSDE